MDSQLGWKYSTIMRKSQCLKITLMSQWEKNNECKAVTALKAILH